MSAVRVDPTPWVERPVDTADTSDDEGRELVMQLANVSSELAADALLQHEGDVVNALMALSGE